MSFDTKEYFIYTVKVKGKEKWSFGTTENIDLKEITVEKELKRNKKD